VIVLEEKDPQNMSPEDKYIFIKQGFHQFLMTQYQILEPLLGTEKAREAVSSFILDEYELFNPNGVSTGNVVEELQKINEKFIKLMNESKDFSDQEYYADLTDNISRTITIIKKYN